MRVKILGRYWELTVKPLHPNDAGECEPPDTPNKQIRIAPKYRDRLDILIHECLHAAAWQMLSEEWVSEFAEDLARILTRVGYVKQKHKKEKNEV